jgi:hypothetical protein
MAGAFLVGHERDFERGFYGMLEEISFSKSLSGRLWGEQLDRVEVFIWGGF